MSKEDQSLKKQAVLTGFTATLAAAFFSAAALGAFNDQGLDSDAADTLRKSGYEPVEVGGYGWFDCMEAGIFSTKFKALNPQGQEVEGTVCDGVFASSSIRLD